jgi:hypothetical protein
MPTGITVNSRRPQRTGAGWSSIVDGPSRRPRAKTVANPARRRRKVALAWDARTEDQGRLPSARPAAPDPRHRLVKQMARGGLEPPTPRFSVECSTGLSYLARGLNVVDLMYLATPSGRVAHRAGPPQSTDKLPLRHRRPRIDRRATAPIHTTRLRLHDAPPCSARLGGAQPVLT